MHEAHDVRLPDMSVTVFEACRKDPRNLPTILIQSMLSLKCLGRGDVKHAGLGSPAADACKPHGLPCALTGFFTLSVHPQKKKKRYRVKSEG